MEEWFKITLLLCIYGMLREIRPSEPYVTEFLSGEWRNITSTQINQNVYPVGTYSYVSLLVVVFLVTDFLRFKPVILISNLSAIIVYIILLWTESLEWLQISQFMYGLFMATEVAYYTYIFAKVEPKNYPKASSYTHVATLSGRFISGITAQLLVTYNIMDYRQLNYITLTAQIAATLWVFMLPSVKYSTYFHQHDKLISSDNNREIDYCDRHHYREKVEWKQYKSAMNLIREHAVNSYKRKKVIIWSLVYAFSLCLFTQVQYYVQILWMEIVNDLSPDAPEYQPYNGFVEAILTFLGACGAWLASIFRPNWLPGVLSLVQSGGVLFASWTGVNMLLGLPMIYYSYIGYIVIGFSYHYLITQSSTKIAGELSDESCFGLIFGINTLVSMLMQSLLTFIITSPYTLKLNIYQQYYVISVCYLVLAVTWFVGYLVKVFVY